MSKFRTEINPGASGFTFNHESRLMFIGSCFSENIGNWLSELKFDVLINPYGITFNPLNIAMQLCELSEGKIIQDSDLFEHRELFSSYDFHSKFNSTDKKKAVDKMQSSQRVATSWLPKIKVLFITLGTSYAYRLKSNGRLVNNCHKVPGNQFEKILTESPQQVEELKRVLEPMLYENPELRIVFTVSPVRHWKDGAIQNQLSKSHLLISCHKLCEELDRTSYFPAYEIMMDELRDYRFYGEDMLHPSPVAIHYIKEIFTEVYFDEQTKLNIQKIEEINRDLAHIPRNPESQEHKAFLKASINKIKKLDPLIQKHFK